MKSHFVFQFIIYQDIHNEWNHLHHLSFGSLSLLTGPKMAALNAKQTSKQNHLANAMPVNTGA